MLQINMHYQRLLLTRLFRQALHVSEKVPESRLIHYNFKDYKPNQVPGTA